MQIVVQIVDGQVHEDDLMLRLRENLQLDGTRRRARAQLFGAEILPIEGLHGVEVRVVLNGEEVMELSVARH